MIRGRRWMTALAAAGALAVAACGGSGASSAKQAAGSAATGADSGAPMPAAQLSLVAYSTPQAAYDEIIKAFKATSQGKNITFTESFGASGDQSRAVES